MEKYFVTCDLESTGRIQQDLNPLVSSELQSMRDNISHLIQTSFSDVKCEMVKYQTIVDFFESKRKNDEFIVSLDNGIYIQGAGAYFDSTRVYEDSQDIVNNPKRYTIKQRNGAELGTQIPQIVARFQKSQKKKIVLCDDGIFSGDTLKDVVVLLKENDIQICEIRTILNFSNSNHLGGIPITSMYKDNNCKDWIDERDFFYGVNMSGASFINKKGEINGLPYSSSTGISEKKASIPHEASTEFCSILIGENVEYWNKMNQTNATDLRLSDIPRIAFLSEFYDTSKSIIDILNLQKQYI